MYKHRRRISKDRKLVHIHSVVRVRANVTKKMKKKKRREKKSMSNANRIAFGEMSPRENRWCFECHSNGAHLENFFHILNIVSLKKDSETARWHQPQMTYHTHKHKHTHAYVCMKFWWRMMMVRWWRQFYSIHRVKVRRSINHYTYSCT